MDAARNPGNHGTNAATQVLVTIDTELSSSRHAAGLSMQDNLARSIHGQTSEGAFGIGWQMDQLERFDLRGVFFVDPMPGLVFGPDIVESIVQPILARGHEVQLHVHTEWLQWAPQSPVGGRQGKRIADFDLADQTALISWAKDALIAAGAPPPCAFRAGNYGADDDTLCALAANGITWDSSYNADFRDKACRISGSAEMVDPVVINGVGVLPVAGLWDVPGHFRPAQICAISAWEMRAALSHAHISGAHSFAIVTHSFEMLSRDRIRPNHAVMARFIAACTNIAANPALANTGFSGLRAPRPGVRQPPRLAPSQLRTIARRAEQAIATWRYERPSPRV